MASRPEIELIDLQFDPAQTQLREQIDALQQADLPEDMIDKGSLETMKKAYKQADTLSILVTGKTGAGKSTLVNGILGLDIESEEANTVQKVAEEGSSIREPCTTEVTEHTCKKGQITVTVWDSPGLQDGTDNQEKYLKQMKEKCSERDMTMYCIRVTEGRFVQGKKSDNLDVLAMEKLTKVFGHDFWKNTIIALTFANIIEALHLEWEDLKTQEEKVQAFQGVIQEWRDQIQAVLREDIKVPQVIVQNIRIVPTGHYRRRYLPDRNYWFSSFCWQCFGTIQDPEKQAAMILLNAGRFKAHDEVKESDFKNQPLHKQPIPTEPQEKFFKAKTIVGTIGGGAAVGALTGSVVGSIGFAGGPVGLVTLPVGAAIGAFLGLTGGAAAQAVILSKKR